MADREYADEPESHGASGLHRAVKGSHEKVAWLLLYLASIDPRDPFPTICSNIMRGRLAGSDDGHSVIEN